MTNRLSVSETVGSVPPLPGTAARIATLAVPALPPSAAAESRLMSEQQSPKDARVINTSEFEARCLSLIDEVAETGAPITITKDGQPVSRLIPWPATGSPRRGPPFPSPIGAGRDLIVSYGDLITPVDEHWEAERGNGSDELG